MKMISRNIPCAESGNPVQNPLFTPVFSARGIFAGRDDSTKMRVGIIVLFTSTAAAALLPQSAAIPQPRAAAISHRARTPAMLEDLGAATSFIAIASAFGISSAVSRMSSPAGEDIVPSAVAGERNPLAELPTPSVLSLLYAAIIGLAGKDLVESGASASPHSPRLGSARLGSLKLA